MKLEHEILDSYQVVMRFDDTTRQAAETLYNQYKTKQTEPMVFFLCFIIFYRILKQAMQSCDVQF